MYHNYILNFYYILILYLNTSNAKYVERCIETCLYDLQSVKYIMVIFIMQTNKKVDFSLFSLVLYQVLEYDRSVINDPRVQITDNNVNCNEALPQSDFGEDVVAYAALRKAIVQVWGSKDVVSVPGMSSGNIFF